MSEVDREAQDQLPKPVLERVKEEAEKLYGEVPKEEFFGGDFSQQSAFESGALCLARILAEVPEGGHPPRLTINTCWDDAGPYPAIYGCKVMEWEEKPSIEYFPLSELQALRAQDLLEIERLKVYEETAEAMGLSFVRERDRFNFERERVAKLRKALAFYCGWEHGPYANQAERALIETAETPEGKG